MKGDFSEHFWYFKKGKNISLQIGRLTQWRPRHAAISFQYNSHCKTIAALFFIPRCCPTWGHCQNIDWAGFLEIKHTKSANIKINYHTQYFSLQKIWRQITGVDKVCVGAKVFHIVHIMVYRHIVEVWGRGLRDGVLITLLLTLIWVIDSWP